MLAALLKRPAVLRAVAFCVGTYLDLTLRSTRWTVEGAAHLAPFLPRGALIVACWHERLPLLPALWLRARAQHPGRPVAALASRHRDGMFIAAVMRRFGVRAVHGSTTRLRPGEAARDHGGAAASRQVLAALAEGAAVIVTPDGPRGPRRVAAPGVGALAALARVPVLPVSAQLRHRIVLRSWDRLVLPLPFGRGALVCLPPVPVPRDGPQAGLAEIAAALTEAAERADALCR